MCILGNTITTQTVLSSAILFISCVCRISRSARHKSFVPSQISLEHMHRCAQSWACTKPSKFPELCQNLSESLWTSFLSFYFYTLWFVYCLLQLSTTSSSCKVNYFPVISFSNHTRGKGFPHWVSSESDQVKINCRTGVIFGTDKSNNSSLQKGGSNLTLILPKDVKLLVFTTSVGFSISKLTLRLGEGHKK